MHEFDIESSTKSIEAMALDYEDDKNSMIAKSETGRDYLYEDFYVERDNRIKVDESMNLIFFGPSSSFLRLDTESILHIFLHTTRFKIPISRALLAWDLVTDGKTAAYLQGREYMAFSSLLGVIPEEDLYYVNFGDPSVLKFFANTLLKLHIRKYGILASSYRRFNGNGWYRNSTYINEMGYLICGFPASDLEMIPPKVFKEINTAVFEKIAKCDFNKTKTLYQIATHRDAFGVPYKWSSHEVGRLGALFKCIPNDQVSALALEAMTAITPKVMSQIDQQKLEYFTKEQILRMRKKTRRVYILRMQLKTSLDMSQIAKSGKASYAFFLLIIVNTLCQFLLAYF